MQMAENGRWRRWRRLVLVVVVALLSMVALAWFFPARWALAWIAPQLHGLRMQQVHGSLWHGGADQVLLADGSVLGHVQWQVSRRALFASAPLQVDFAGPQLKFSGRLQAEPNGQVRWDQVQLRANVALWNPHGTSSALGQPRGELWMTVDRAVLQGGWPLQLDLRAHWRDAAVLTRRGKVALGALDLRVTARAGVVDATVSDVAGGPLQVNGTLRLSPLGWSLDARLRARRADPALQHWLAALGTADATGIVHVQRRGGLTLPPVVPTSTTFDVSSTRPQQGSP